MKEEFTGLEHYLVWLQNFKLNTKLGDIFQNMNSDWKIKNFGSKMVHNQDLNEKDLIGFINENVFLIHVNRKILLYTCYLKEYF